MKQHGKKYRVWTTFTKEMCEWIEKKRPAHMSKSAAIEHFFWIGVHANTQQNGPKVSSHP